MSNLESFFSTIHLPSTNNTTHEIIQSLNRDVLVQAVRDTIAKDPDHFMGVVLA